MKMSYLTVPVFASLLLAGCGEESDNSATAQGWHFQGRDCLACHNVDLESEKHLLVGGTLFKSADVTDVDEMSQNCGGELVINFLDTAFSLQVSSRDYEDPDSRGYNGKGNVFMLSRMLDALHGNYYIQIVDKQTNLTLAQSLETHAFNGSDYRVDASMDVNNQRACNACHTDGGPAPHLYVQVNADRCK